MLLTCFVLTVFFDMVVAVSIGVVLAALLFMPHRRAHALAHSRLVALESALKGLQASEKQVVLSGPLPEPRGVFERADLPGHYAHVRFAQDLAAGIALARELDGAGGSD